MLTYANPKTAKGEKKGVLTATLSLAPSDMSGYNVCPKASPGCRAACLALGGRGQMKNVKEARIRKTKMFFEDRAWFFAELIKDIEAGIRKAKRQNLDFAVRLNCFSDLPWERIKWQGLTILERFPEVQFYDYTAVPGRKVPSNYHLTFSRKENNEADVKQAIKEGLNVAAVFEELPERAYGLPVINGDETDLRFQDPVSCIVGLKAKGKAKKDDSGFVITNQERKAA